MSGGPLGCGKKTRYLTQEQAERVARVRALFRPGYTACTVPLYAYECPVCFGWHLSKLKPAEAA